MMKLRDGSWLTAYMYSGLKNRIRIKRSFDNMRTWQYLTDIVDPDRDYDNPGFCNLPDGRIMLGVRSFYRGQTYYVETFISNDQGNSFQHQSVVDGGYAKGVYEPYLYILPDGSLACYYANENHPGYDQTLSMRISQDGGFTWGPERFVIAQPGYPRPGTANIVPLPGGILALFYELCGVDQCYGHIIYSPDGINWPLGFGPTVPETYQAIEALEMTNGLILVSSNNRDLVISPDYTSTWSARQSYPGNYGKWPGLYQTGVNEFVITLAGAGQNGEAGLYLTFGSVDPAAFFFPTTKVCRGLEIARHQACR